MVQTVGSSLVEHVLSIMKRSLGSFPAEERKKKREKKRNKEMGGAGAMVQLTKGLLCKQENLRSGPQCSGTR